MPVVTHSECAVRIIEGETSPHLSIYFQAEPPIRESVNTGCTPTKTMVASAYAARVANRAAEYGVMIDGRVTRGHETGQQG
jgi:hypothetical protein